MSLVEADEVAEARSLLLDEQHLEAAAGGVARDARAVDAAADDQQVVALAGLHEEKPLRGWKTRRIIRAGIRRAPGF